MTRTKTPASVPHSTMLATITFLSGIVVWLTGTGFAIVSFDHQNAQPYSCWNHVISELGFPFASPLTWLYNGALALSSLMLLPIFYALSVHLRRPMTYVASGFGSAAYLALSGVGILGLRQDLRHAPYIFMPFYRLHMALAGACYLGWLVAMALFAILFCRRWKDPASRPMALVGIACCLVYPTFFAAVLHPNPMQAALAKDLRDPAFRAILNSPSSVPILSPWLDLHRPHIWLPAALEWIWAWSMLLWAGTALVFLWTKTARAVDHSGAKDA
jgi:hypothetical protein